VCILESKAKNAAFPLSHYSYLKLSTGFDRADLRIFIPTDIRAIRITPIPETKNIQKAILVLYA
jgi:hypothetical protein